MELTWIKRSRILSGRGYFFRSQSERYLLLSSPLLNGHYVPYHTIGIQNPSSNDNDWNSWTWNPECKVVLDFLITWGEFSNGDRLMQAWLYRLKQMSYQTWSCIKWNKFLPKKKEWASRQCHLIPKRTIFFHEDWKIETLINTPKKRFFSTYLQI